MIHDKHYYKPKSQVHPFTNNATTIKTPSFWSTLWNWQPKKDYLALQLIRESSIHGIKYITQPDRHIMERLFWIITNVFCVGASIYLSHRAVEKLLESPVIVSFQPAQTPIAKVPFPAITVCNVNRFRKSAFEKALRMATNKTLEETEESQLVARIFLRELDHVCDSSRSFSVRLNYSLDETTVNLRNRVMFGHNGPKKIDTDTQHNLTGSPQHQHMVHAAIQTCEEMIPLCLWEGKVQNCSDIFTVIVTDLGICCTFNMMPKTMLLNTPNDHAALVETQKWKKFEIDASIFDQDSPDKEDDDYEFPKHQSKAGQGSGLSLLLNPELDEYFCAGHDAFGFRLLPHSSIDWAHVAEFGIGVPPSSEILINLMADITVADDTIKGLDLDDRWCYYVDEIELEFYNYYTKTNCIDECIAKKIIHDCKCIRFGWSYGYFKIKKCSNRLHTLNCPRLEPPNTTGLNYCEGKPFQCSQEVHKKIEIQGTKRYCGNCLPSCNRIEYRAETSSFPIENDNAIWLKNKKYAKWAGKNVSIVHIFFGSDTVYSRVRSRLYGFNELFGGSNFNYVTTEASVGGILGLFLGLSVMSVVEPFYFLVRYFIEPESAARARTARATTANLSGEAGKMGFKAGWT